jgi:hypothetical protein
MAQQTTRDQVITLIGTAISEVWGQNEDLIKPLYPRFLNKETSSHPRHISYQTAYFGQFPNKPEGENIQYDDLKFGDPLTIDPDTYALGVRFTKEALDDMAMNPFGDFSSAQLVSAATLGKKFREAAAQTRDVLAAQVILSGSSATATSTWVGAGWDGKALFANDHPILSNTSILGGTSYDNLGSGVALSYSALQTALTAVETQPTLEGLVRPLRKKWKLVVGPANRHVAFTAVETAIGKRAVTGSNNNDVPGLADFSIDVVVNPFLGATSTKWTLFSEDADVCYWERQKDVIDDEKDFESKGHKWSCDFRFKIFHKDSFGTFSDAGA